MEHIVTAWDMAGLAIGLVAVVAEALADRSIVKLAIEPAVVAEALVGHQAEICP